MNEDKESVVKYIKQSNLDNNLLNNLNYAVKYFNSYSEYLIKKKYFPTGIEITLPKELKLNPFKELSKSNLPFIISSIAMIERQIYQNAANSKELIETANQNTKILSIYKNKVSSLPSIQRYK